MPWIPRDGLAVALDGPLGERERPRRVTPRSRQRPASAKSARASSAGVLVVEPSKPRTADLGAKDVRGALAETEAFFTAVSRQEARRPPKGRQGARLDDP